MKKRMKTILGVMVLGSICMGFTACGNSSKKAETSINSHIIESRNNIFAGADDNYYATFCSGEREEPYALDGVVNNKIAFGIVTFGRKDNDAFLKTEFAFTIKIGEEQKQGTLQKSPYDNTYSYDVMAIADDQAEIRLTVQLNGSVFDVPLYNESKNFKITKDDAIKKASEELKTSLNSMKDLDGKTCEALIKILKDYSGETNKYFWYVGVVSADGNVVGVLIDTQSGVVISKKI